MLLVAGTALAFAPGVPTLVLDPELVLLVLLPPLLYSSGVGMSWRGFRANLRPILLLAIGCVLFTAAAVAAVAHYALGTSWAVGFVLGAIVSPPDAVAPMSVLRAMRLPRRLVTVLEGESLVNDATALVAFSFALGAVATGSFSAGDAAAKFAVVVVGEIAYGMTVGWAALSLRHLSRDPRAEVLLALATPFIAFWPPHMLGGSGVVACVTAGLWVSWNGRRLIQQTRLPPGLLLLGSHRLGGRGARACSPVCRPAQSSRACRQTTSRPPRALLAAAGQRLTVGARAVRVGLPCDVPSPAGSSSATRRSVPGLALALPRLLRGLARRGQHGRCALDPAHARRPTFPDRDLVLFATFCVITVTLVGLGGALSRVVHWLGVGRAGAEEAASNKRDERAVRLEGIDAVLAAIDRAAQDGESPIAVAALHRRHADRRQHRAATATRARPTTRSQTKARCSCGFWTSSASRSRARMQTTA